MQHRRRTTSPPTQQPSLPLPLQHQPQQQQQPSSSTSGPSTSSSTAQQQQQQPNLSNEQWAVFINQRMSGMPNATNLSEWQLQAVLFHAKLTQYYDRFISLGGDDIDQLMQCDETEFLEIMRLIGMASKPLHVRRFQRTLADFSKDRAKFLRQAAVHIGPPPVMDFPTSSQTSSLQAAIQFLIPGFNPSEQQASTSSTTSITTALSLPGSSSSTMPQQQLLQPSTSTESPVTATMPRLYPQTSAPFFRPQLLQQQPSTSTSVIAAAASATANVMPLPSSELLNLVGSSISNLSIPSISPSVVTIPPSSTTVISSRTESPAIAGPSGCGSNQSVASPGSDTEYTGDPFEGGVLPETDVTQIIRLSKNLYSKKPDLHTLEPRYVQNKKKLPKELIDVMKLPAEDKNRLSEFRKFSAIYGRYDAKRKPDKPLSYHELLVNEAAAQLCLIQPVLLTRRDELFPLARQVVRESNFPGFRTLSRTERKRPYDTKSERSTSPHSVASNRSDSPELSTLERRSSSSHPKHDPSPNTPSTRSSTSGGKRAKSEY